MTGLSPGHFVCPWVGRTGPALWLSWWNWVARLLQDTQWTKVCRPDSGVLTVAFILIVISLYRMCIFVFLVAFDIFLFIDFFQQFNSHVMARHVCVCLFCLSSLSFVDPWPYNFYQIWNIFSHNFFRYFYVSSVSLLPLRDHLYIYIWLLNIICTSQQFFLFFLIFCFILLLVWFYCYALKFIIIFMLQCLICYLSHLIVS